MQQWLYIHGPEILRQVNAVIVKTLNSSCSTDGVNKIDLLKTEEGSTSIIKVQKTHEIEKLVLGFEVIIWGVRVTRRLKF